MAEGRPGLRLWDRLVLFVAWGATCGIVFLLGLSVGRGTRQPAANSEERMVRLPVNVPAPAPGPAAVPGEDVTFYERLVAADRGQDRRAPLPAAHEPPLEPTPPAVKPRAVAAPATPNVAQATAAAAAKAVGAAAPPKPAAIPAPTVPKPVAVVAPSKAPTVVARATLPAPAAAKPAGSVLANATPTPMPVVPKPSPGPQQAKAAPVPLGPGLSPGAPPTDKPAPRAWTVTINPTADRYEAEALMHQLKAKGYSATMAQNTHGSAKEYRVRIGRYGTPAEAASAAKKLAKDGLQGAVPASTE